MQGTGSSSKAFLGVRFALFGFQNPVYERQLRSKLVNGGGVDAADVTQSFTHLIVDNNVVYDDPVCVAARNEGKVVVAGLWVDHSYDVGLPVDSTSVMYRPLRDLNGIPGGRNLVICLTGYQRQDREDVMTMVNLMGAQFSKPLVASKVTHLICYKFEGEKYELAKRLMKIKLVNHRWLEDSLREWKLLPEENYSKSGYELETMEAEAKDSEDDVEDSALNHSSCNKVEASPRILKSETPRACELPKSSKEVSNMLCDLGDPDGEQGVSNVVNALTTPGRNNRYSSSPSVRNSIAARSPDCSNAASLELPYHEDKSPDQTVLKTGTPRVSDLLKPSGKVPNVSRELGDSAGELGVSVDCNNVISPGRKSSCNGSLNAQHILSAGLPSDAAAFTCATAIELPREQDGDCHARKMETKFESVSMSAEKPQSTEKFSSFSYYGKRKSPPSVLSKMGDKATSSSLQGFKPSNTSPFQVESVLNLPDGDLCEVPHKGSHLLNKEASCSKKPKADVQFSSSKDQELNLDGEACVTGRPSVCHMIEGLESSLDDSQFKFTHNSPIVNHDRSSNGLDRLKSARSTTFDDTNAKSPEVKEKSVAETVSALEKVTWDTDRNRHSNTMPSDRIHVEMKQSISEWKPDDGKLGEKERSDIIGDVQEQQNQQLDTVFPSSSMGNLDSDNSRGSAGFNVLKGGNDNPLNKPFRKKVVAKKTLGSRQNLSVANQKGSIYSSKTVDQPSIGLIEKEEIGGVGKLSNGNELWASAANDIKVREVGTKSVTKLGDDGDKMNDLVDDETEAPEEKDECENFVVKETTDAIHLTNRGHNKTEAKAESPGRGRSMENGDTAEVLKEHGSSMENRDTAEVLKGHESAARAPGKLSKGRHWTLGKSKQLALPSAMQESASLTVLDKDEINVGKIFEGRAVEKEKGQSLRHEILGGSMENLDANELREKIEPAAGGVSFQKKIIKDRDRLSGKNKQQATPFATEEPAAVEVLVMEETHIDKKLPHESAGRGALRGRLSKDKPRELGKSKPESVTAVIEEAESKRSTAKENKEVEARAAGQNTNQTLSRKKREGSVKEKENLPVSVKDQSRGQGKRQVGKTVLKAGKMLMPDQKTDDNQTSVTKVEVTDHVESQPVCFILSGHRLQRKEFQQIIRRLRGKFCRDSHQWSYQATHFIAAEPIRRTEKFFAATASGSWILKTDYLTACNQAGKFLPEEPYEWHANGLSEDGAISLEAPRKWRLIRERTGHGAFHELRVVVYGECIAPSLDTLKRVMKAGGGTVLATSPPYTRFLSSGVDYAIISPVMPRFDLWVQEFLNHEIPCVLADYLVEYVCKPWYSLDKHILYNTHAWAEKSFANLLAKEKEIVIMHDQKTPDDSNSSDVACQVCSSRDRGEVMLICGDESGSTGCGMGMHIDCCDPPLEDVPLDDWFCLSCSQKSNNTASVVTSKKRKKTSSSSKS